MFQGNTEDLLLSPLYLLPPVLSTRCTCHYLLYSTNSNSKLNAKLANSVRFLVPVLCRMHWQSDKFLPNRTKPHVPQDLIDSGTVAENVFLNTLMLTVSASPLSMTNCFVCHVTLNSKQVVHDLMQHSQRASAHFAQFMLGFIEYTELSKHTATMFHQSIPFPQLINFC